MRETAKKKTGFKFGSRCRKVLALVCAAAMATCFAFALPASGVTVKAAHTLPDTSFTQIPNSPLYFSPSVSTTKAYNNTAYYLMLPTNVQQRLIADNVKIYLIAYNDEKMTSKRITTYGDSRVGVAALTTHPTYQSYIYQSTGELAFTTRVKDGTIEIQTATSAKTKIDSYRLIHETGHYIDTATGAATGTLFAISNSNDWINYYNAYGSQIINYSAYSAAPSLYNQSEAWADAFELSIVNPTALQAISPDLYNYVTTLTAALPAYDVNVDYAE